MGGQSANASQGISGDAYTDGQSGSGTAVLYWTVPMNPEVNGSPVSTLYYQCTIHGAMNGTINIIG